MPAFTYKAKDRQGQLINGSLEADSRAAVISRLQAMGYFPIDIQGGEKKKGGSLGGERKKRIKSTDLTDFYVQMSDLIGSGVPLVKALNVVKNQTAHPTMAEVLGAISSDVQGGETFARALEKHPRHFTKLVVALVRAGETGGLLDETLRRIADYSEAQDELRSKIKSAMAYPIIMVFVLIGVVLFLLTYVLPKVLTIYDDLDQTMPGMTLFLIAVVDFLRGYWPYLVGGLIAAGFVFSRWIKTDSGQSQFHHLVLRMPLVGDLFLKREIAAFARTLGSLLRNGVPILNSLKIASEVLSFQPIRAEIAKIPESITQGAGIAPSLRESPLFPPVVVNMVAVGEETGHLPEVLLRVAHSYEMQVERAIKTVTSFIEPFIILSLGLIVGFVVMAMLLPIFSIDPTSGM